MGWMRRTNISCLVLFLIFFSAKVSAQDTLPDIYGSEDTVIYEDYETDYPVANKIYESGDSTSLKKFDERRWEKLTKELDYSEDVKKKKEEEASSLPELNINPTVIKVVLISVVIGVLIFLLFKIFGNAVFLKNTKIKNGDFSFLDEAEENLEESDLERYLKDALANKQYKIAVRIYYLMSIKELMLNNFIIWKKNKTNFEYLNEMRGKKEFDHFRSLTHAFEIVWYGDVEINENDFAVLSPSFGSFINSIRNNGHK